MQLAWSNNYWKTLKYFQFAATNHLAETHCHRAVFDLRKKDFFHQEHFDLAFSEATRLYTTLIPQAEGQPCPCLDRHLVSELASCPEVICDYYMYKIYHFLKVFHKIELELFVGEFVENAEGLIEFFNAKVYRINSDRDFLYSQAPVAKLAFLNSIQKRATAKIKQDIVAENHSKLMKYVDRLQKKREASKAEPPNQDHLMIQEDFEDYSASSEEGRKPLLEEESQHLLNQLKKELAEDEIQNELFFRMKHLLAKRFQDMRVDLRKRNAFKQNLEDCEVVFKTILPDLQVHLKDIVMDEFLDLEWAQKRARDPKNLIPCLNPALNLRNRNDLKSSKSKSVNLYKDQDLTAGTNNYDFHLDDLNEVFQESAGIQTDLRKFITVVGQRNKARVQNLSTYQDASELDLKHDRPSSHSRGRELEGLGPNSSAFKKSKRTHNTRITSFSYGRPTSNTAHTDTVLFPEIKKKINKIMSQLINREHEETEGSR